MSSQPKSSIQIWPLARPLTMSRQKAPQPISLIMIDPFHQQGSSSSSQARGWTGQGAVTIKIIKGNGQHEEA
jgi:hypothetical protein